LERAKTQSHPKKVAFHFSGCRFVRSSLLDFTCFTQRMGGSRSFHAAKDSALKIETHKERNKKPPRAEA
jgi:hypothetical protein